MLNTNKKLLDDASYTLEWAGESVNSVINMLDAVTVLFRPIDDGDVTPAQVEDIWRMADAILGAARGTLAAAADDMAEVSGELSELAKAAVGA